MQSSASRRATIRRGWHVDCGSGPPPTVHVLLADVDGDSGTRRRRLRVAAGQGSAVARSTCRGQGSTGRLPRPSTCATSRCCAVPAIESTGSARGPRGAGPQRPRVRRPLQQRAPAGLRRFPVALPDDRYPTRRRGERVMASLGRGDLGIAEVGFAVTVRVSFLPHARASCRRDRARLLPCSAASRACGSGADAGYAGTRWIAAVPAGRPARHVHRPAAACRRLGHHRPRAADPRRDDGQGNQRRHSPGRTHLDGAFRPAACQRRRGRPRAGSRPYGVRDGDVRDPADKLIRIQELPRAALGWHRSSSG